MRSKYLLIALGSVLAGCQTPGTPDNPAKGLASVNVPVVTSADYLFDAAAPCGALAQGEGEHLSRIKLIREIGGAGERVEGGLRSHDLSTSRSIAA